MLIEATTFNHLKRLSSPLRLAPPTGGSEQVAIGLLAAVLLLVFVSAVAPGTQAAEPLAVEYLWQHEPDLGFSWQPPEVSPQLDITAADFESPYAHTRLRAAQTALRLTQQSRQEPQLLQAIMNRLEKGETQPYVRAAFVAAACAIDDGSLAERLWQICKGDPLTRPTVEQACIGWSSPVCVELWRKSLLDSTATDQERIRALNGLGAAGEQQDLELLTNEVTDGAVPASRR